MAENMDLAEILAPQFVVPVAAVVLCAFVVFVFGFKHVAEPNFDFDSSDEKKRRHRSKKSKPQSSNGHVTTYENSKTVSQVAAPGVATEKTKDLPQKIKEQRVKKPVTPTVNKNTTKQTKPDSSSIKQEVETEGWTTCTSKKGKKKKGDHAKSAELVAAVATETPIVEDDTSKNEVSPQEQREVKSRRDRALKAEFVAEDQLGAEEDIKTEQPPEEKVEEDKNVTKREIPGLELKHEETTPSKKKRKKKNTNKASSAVTSDSTSTASHPEGTPSDSTHTSSDVKPKASDVRSNSSNVSSSQRNADSANSKQTEAEERLEINITEQPDVEKKTECTNPIDTSIEGQIADAMRESPQPSPTELIPSKTHKKSAKKKNKSSSSKEAGIHLKSSQIHSETHDPPQQEMLGASTQLSSHSDANTVTTVKLNTEVNTEVKSAACTINAGGDAVQTQPPKSDSQPLEDAEWQDAKQVKKRKKARRDN